MKQTSHKTLIGSFLIIGTLLALYITVDGGYDLFWVHNTWMYRDGLIQKIGFVVISADFALLALAGLVSTVSFFLKKQILYLQFAFALNLWYHTFLYSNHHNYLHQYNCQTPILPSKGSIPKFLYPL